MANEIISQATTILSKVLAGNSVPSEPRKAQQKLCPNCHKEVFGPSYKKYCDAKCHDTYNNKKKAEKCKEMKKVNGPTEQNDKFLAKLHAKNEKKDWPLAMLDHPDFNRKARCSILKDDRLELMGKQYLHYSIYPNNNNNTFRILYHEHCNL